jgi:hypothetical protein
MGARGQSAPLLLQHRRNRLDLPCGVSRHHHPHEGVGGANTGVPASMLTKMVDHPAGADQADFAASGPVPLRANSTLITFGRRGRTALPAIFRS